jgi:hypothetical protein
MCDTLSLMVVQRLLKPTATLGLSSVDSSLRISPILGLDLVCREKRNAVCSLGQPAHRDFFANRRQSLSAPSSTVRLIRRVDYKWSTTWRLVASPFARVKHHGVLIVSPDHGRIRPADGRFGRWCAYSHINESRLTVAGADVVESSVNRQSGAKQRAAVLP